MIISPYKMLLSPSGRMGRKDFWVAMVIFSILVVLFNFALQRLGNSTSAFLISLPFPFLVLHMLYSIYGKRLHDMGRSFWPLTGMIVLTVMILFGVGIYYGAGDYVSEFAKYGRKDVVDPKEVERLQKEYWAQSEGGDKIISVASYAVWTVFTLWCGLSKTEPEPNNYGPPAT